jgi:hypothetical protein
MAILLEPGKGMYREPPPVKTFNEYPKHMKHPGFQPGVPDQEIKVIDPQTGKPTGRLIYTGGKSIRFPDVLVHDAQQEEYHKSQGYQTIGKSDAGAFARAVADASPMITNYVPIQYPKWAGGKLVNNEQEEREALIAAGVRMDDLPAPSKEDIVEGVRIVTEVAAEREEKTPEQLEIEMLKAKIAALEADKSIPTKPLYPGKQQKPKKPNLKMTAAQRQAVSERMRAMWARKKALKEAIASNDVAAMLEEAGQIE